MSRETFPVGAGCVVIDEHGFCTFYVMKNYTVVMKDQRWTIMDDINRITYVDKVCLIHCNAEAMGDGSFVISAHDLQINDDVAVLYGPGPI